MRTRPSPLDDLDLERKLSKHEYEDVLPELQLKLADRATRARVSGVATAVVFEGWFGSGKGDAITDLTQWLDARGFKVHWIGRQTRHGEATPWLRRFARREPSKGQLGLFERSWYLRVTDDLLDGRTEKKDLPRLFREIRWFERLWIDGGVVLVKVFLHLSKGEQKRRVRARREDPTGRWVLDRDVKAQLADHKGYKEAVEQMLIETHAPGAEWHVVAAEDPEVARLEVFRTVLEAMEKRLALLGALGDAPKPAPAKRSKKRPSKSAGKAARKAGA